MRRFFAIALLLCFQFSLYAQPVTDTTGQDTGHQTTAKPTSTPKGKGGEKPVDKTDTKPVTKSEKTEETSITQPTDAFSNWLKLLAVAGLLVVMVWGLVHIFNYVESSEVFIGHNTIKLIAFVILLPSICILSLVSPNTIQGAVLATLLGTISGYVLSRNQEDDKNTNKDGGKKGAIGAGTPGGREDSVAKAGGTGAHDVDAARLASLQQENKNLQQQLDDLKAKLAAGKSGTA